MWCRKHRDQEVFSFHNKSLYSCNKNTILSLYISLWIKTCNTVMRKLVISFLSISQIVKAGKLQQKARQEGQYRLEDCALNGLWRLVWIHAITRGNTARLKKELLQHKKSIQVQHQNMCELMHCREAVAVSAVSLQWLTECVFVAQSAEAWPFAAAH